MLTVATCAGSGREGGGVMPRRLRVPSEGATDHLMSRGDGRQDIVADVRDRRHFVEVPGAQAGRSGWEPIGFVPLSNHSRLLVRTPRADLAGGMQRSTASHRPTWLAGATTPARAPSPRGRAVGSPR